MKKIVTILILFIFVSPVFAEIQPPQWSEFCPPQYLNAEYIKDNTLPPIVGFLCACSLVGIPISAYDLNKKKSINDNNYWVRRREAFNSRINRCKQLTSDTELMYCYLTERQKQAENDSNLRMSELENQQRALYINQCVQHSNMQSQINNVQTQNQFNKIKYGY